MKIRKMIDGKVIVSFWVILTICFLSFTCWAAGPARVRVNATEPQRLSLVLGKSIIIESEDPVTRVSCAAPDIANAVVLTPRQIYLTGKAPGITNLTLWDTSNRVSTIIDIDVLPDVARLKEKLYQMFPEEKNISVTVSPDAVNLTGTVTSAADLSQVLGVAQSYAPKDKEGKPRVNNYLEVRGVQQVMLEVRVSEMSRTLLRQLGINFSYISANGQNFGISLLNQLTTAASPSPGAVTGSNSVNAILRFLGGGATWTVFIDALKENDLTKVLAEPTLITLSGQTANFLAGGEYPIPVPQSGAGVGTVPTITIEYKQFGVSLSFTPTVLSNNKISMKVSPEVSELDFTQAISLQGYVIPSLTTRRVSTVIELADGQSFAIAGLLKDEVKEIAQKYPVLGDIPILGVLFRSSSFQKSETELIVIVTPHLVKPLDMAKQTLPTDQYIEPNDFEFYVLGKMEGEGGYEKNPPLKNGGGLEGDFGHIKP